MSVDKSVLPLDSFKMESLFKFFLPVLLCHVVLSQQKTVSSTPANGTSEVSSNSSVLDQSLRQSGKEAEDSAVESPAAAGLERTTPTAASLYTTRKSGKMLYGLELATTTSESLSSEKDDAETQNDASKVDGHRSPSLEYLVAHVKQTGATSPSPFRGLRRRTEGQNPIGETEREGARGAAGSRSWSDKNPRIRISVDTPGYVQRSEAKVSSHVRDGPDPSQGEAVYALGRSDNSRLFGAQRSPYSSRSSSRGRRLDNQLPDSGLYSRHLLESDLSLLFDKLLKVEEELSRLKETLLLQGSVHIRTSQRLESLVVSQIRLGLQNSQDSTKILRRLEHCCTCSTSEREPGDLVPHGTRSQTVTDRAFKVTSFQSGTDAVSSATSYQTHRHSVSSITLSPTAVTEPVSYVTSPQRANLEFMSKVRLLQRASAETRTHTRDDNGRREQGSDLKDSTRQENTTSVAFFTTSMQASPSDPSVRNHSIGVPIGTVPFHTTPTTLSESARNVNISIPESTTISGASASAISSERKITDKATEGDEESKILSDEQRAEIRKDTGTPEEKKEEEEEDDNESDDDDESEEKDEEGGEEKDDSKSDESDESDEEGKEKDEDQKDSRLKEPYAAEDDDDKENGNHHDDGGDDTNDEKQDGDYAGGENVGMDKDGKEEEKQRKLKMFAGSEEKRNKSKSRTEEFKSVEDRELEREEAGEEQSESRKIQSSTNSTVQDHSNKASREDPGFDERDKEKTVIIATDDVTLHRSSFDSANINAGSLNLTTTTAGDLSNLTEDTEPRISSDLSTESLDAVLQMTTLPVASSPGHGDDVILKEGTEDKRGPYEPDSRVVADWVTVGRIVAVHDASSSSNVSRAAQRKQDPSQNNQPRQANNTRASQPVFFVDGDETVSVRTSAGGEVNTTVVTATQAVAAEHTFLRRNHTPSVDYRKAQPAKGDGVSNGSSTVTKDGLDGVSAERGKVNDAKDDGHGPAQSDEASRKVARIDINAKTGARDGEDKETKWDRGVGEGRASLSGHEPTTAPRAAEADPVSFDPFVPADSNFTVPDVSATIAVPLSVVAESVRSTTAASWSSPPAEPMSATSPASRPSTPTAGRVATTRWFPRLPFTTTATTTTATTATTIPRSAGTRDRASRTQPISAGSQSAMVEPEKPKMEVDLSAGTVKGEVLPGVTWATPLDVPRNVTARRARERNRRGKRQLSAPCSLQGVLKFTFTPPPQGSQRLPTRYYHPRGRFQSSQQGPESYRTPTNDSRQELEVDLWFQNPKSWVFNLGDSIANNGFSGDGSVQENDCEVQGYGTSFSVYGSDKHPNVRQKLLQGKRNFIYDRVTLVVSDQTIFWNNYRGESATLRDPSLFALAGQSDHQGDVNYDVYLGLNRVVDGDYRSGQGLCRVVVKWLK